MKVKISPLEREFGTEEAIYILPQKKIGSEKNALEEDLIKMKYIFGGGLAVGLIAFVTFCFFGNYKSPAERGYFSQFKTRLNFEDRNGNGKLESYLKINDQSYELRKNLEGEPILRKIKLQEKSG